ncbi:maltodextrin glucosidase [Deinococcus cellulosilyticus]|uniref:Maltodextrin glucosidase n=1 Tax=Deinococcus cellulosilyticus (strain DSM 18568 / NBRC 106333 / KACC 11606 / 5516J-15) TaxID=1223518 RepID=A0A511MX59_DEIC1|nr:maltodextrin glucosidase [Deinococcus cellulosilyticus]GEM44726.1 maltodextrin glucosidase [Deinococcus cellulosilyticus NBRC 106333 = KACC 11606]
MQLYHDGTPFFLQREGDIARVFLEAEPAIEQGWAVGYLHGASSYTELKPYGDGRWVAEMPVTHHQKFHYRFKVIVNGRVWWLNQAGVSPSAPSVLQDFSFSSKEPPVWVRNRIFYQIFPDRFKIGEPGIRVQKGQYRYTDKEVETREWDELPRPETGYMEFYGGNLEGIRQSISYFQELGINALYLNPIFESPSAHKYDTQDYHRIDPHFGSNEGFAKLVDELHEQDIRVMLDGVFNHTGDWHRWMNKAGRYEEPGAYQSENFRQYYNYSGENPDDYLSWLGFSTLPKLNYAHHEVRGQIYANPDSVIRFWLKAPYNIDAWRLDVASMIGSEGTDKDNKQILAELWEAARETKPDTYILGEQFGDATLWVQGGVEDATMNYFAFMSPTWSFLADQDHKGHPTKLDAREYAEALTRPLSHLPFNHQLAAFNLLDSHDVKRFATVCPDLAKRKLGVALLFGFIGVPCIYYGDEIGLEGADDPDNRRTMPWDDRARWDSEIYQWYRTWIQLRHQEVALREGSFRILHAEGDHLVFERRYGNERVLILMTRGTPLQHDLSGSWTDLISKESLEGPVRISSTGVRILKQTV